MNRRFFVALAALVLGLVAAELILRVLRVPAPAQRTDLVDSRWRSVMDFGDGPGDFWRLRQAGDDDPVNSLGMRGYDPAPAGPSDLRIAILGGGSAFGLDLAYGQTFGARLERNLQRELPHARIQVLLAAAPDYSSHQMLAAWRRSVRAFAPHVLLVHSEPWSDATTALGHPDGELATQAAARPALHLLALFARPPEATGAVRVPLESYEANLRALFAEAAAANTEVLAASAARGPKATARWPAVKDYARAHDAVAAAAYVGLIDLGGLLGGLTSVAGAAGCTDIGETPTFRDGVHLTAPAHVVVADALLPRVRTTRRYRELRESQPPPGAPTLTAVEPAQVTALSATEVTLRGTGLAAAPRAYVGASLARVIAVDDTTLRITLPRDVLPGSQTVEIVTEHGGCTFAGSLVVAGADLQASLRRANGRVHTEASGKAPPGSTVQIWLAHAARTQPIPTIAGAFWLRHILVDDPKRAPLFCYGTLQLPTATTTAGQDGAWHIDTELDSPSLMPGTSAALQGVIWFPDWPGHGVTTAVLPLPIAH